jgi:predicted transposase/invertase (TIGR01784 family)
MANTLIRFDWAMKKMLRQKAHFAILEGFLSELLKEDITIEEILDGESNQYSPEDKYNRADILARKADGELVIIEVQNNKEIDYFQRMLYGVSKVTGEHIHLGEPYSRLKKVYSVNIVYFDLGQGKDYVYHGKTCFRGVHEGDVLQLSQKQKELFEKDDLHKLFPEYYVIKINSFNDVAKDSLDEWIYYLKNDEVMKGAKAKGLKEVEEQLRIQGLGETEQREYYRHMENNRLAMGLLYTARIEGEAEGEIRGKKEQAIFTGRKLKSLGMDNKTIADCTGLTIEEAVAL